jgi:rhodanese-related sulfurtransferase
MKSPAAKIRAMVSQVQRRAAVLLLLALCLGVVSSVYSPLGVRSADAQERAANHHHGSGVFNHSREAGVTEKEAGDASIAKIAPAGKPRPTTWREAGRLLQSGKAVLVDVRPRHLFQAGHVPGAVSLPYTSKAADLARFAVEQGRETPLILYCGSATCSLAERFGAKLLSEAGFASVAYVPGGYAEYVQTEHGRASGRFEEESENPAPLNWNAAQALLSQSGGVLVDARTSARFYAGQITGAVSLPLESGSEQFIRFQQDYDRSAPVIVYCESRGCPISRKLAYVLAKEYGFERVYHLETGFKEWRIASGR